MPPLLPFHFTQNISIQNSGDLNTGKTNLVHELSNFKIAFEYLTSIQMVKNIIHFVFKTDKVALNNFVKCRLYLTLCQLVFFWEN